ncbi:hypothetical protein Tco_1382038, partial [Tanacetum coccineum]
EVNDDIFDPEGDIIENLLNLDKTKDLPPYHDNPLSGSTSSSSPSLSIFETKDYFLKEFADELAHFAFPPGIDYLPFDAESDLREIKYLLNHEPIKEMDSILEDSIDSFDDNLFYTISEMFTDEHALDYLSPPLWDDYDDELLDLKTINDDTYDDPFYSKEEKIKDSKILINELDHPKSSIFLPSPECDLVFYEDFSEVDALPSTNNGDKVFNPGILIHESHFIVTNCETMEKNIKKTTNTSLILEDLDPPLSLYELPFHKEVPGLEALLSALKLSKSLKFLKARRRFFLALMERTSVFWMFHVSISIPLDKLKIARIFEASRARCFVLRSQELHILSFILGIRYPNLID